MHRLRISDEEITIILEGLKLLTKEFGYIQDDAHKVLIWRTFQRFHSLADKDPVFLRPRRRRYHKEVVEEFRATQSI